uniref:Uncharacterized protein n=1 Tax=Timema poppense TaxID=170557 RepID=A0A7R9CIV7_TIMPO|nr:unnamed protein product [Timema poppensis]
MMYYFLSTVADVSANPYINASAIYFAPNSSYSPSYRGFFNKTMPLFAPRTFRCDLDRMDLRSFESGEVSGVLLMSPALVFSLTIGGRALSFSLPLGSGVSPFTSSNHLGKTE